VRRPITGPALLPARATASALYRGLEKGAIMSNPTNGTADRHRVVVVGGGFGGLYAVRKLRHAPVDVTLIDRRNFHLFQPLVYQVATGALSPGEVAAPLRGIFKRSENVRVVLGEVTGFDLAGKQVLVDRSATEHGLVEIPYDSLIVAGGSHYSYFGRDEWEPLAPDIKSLEHALEVRRKVLTAFEAAEEDSSPEPQAAWLTFLVVGGGPTGVELAGQIAEISRDTLRRNFRNVDPRGARILLVEMDDRILPQFPPRLSKKAARSLEELGVTPMPGHKVVDIEEDAVTLADSSGTEVRIPARTVVWAAGVVASELAGMLAAEAGVDVDRGGRVPVGPDLTVAGHPGVFAVGDMVSVHGADGSALGLPGLAPVAIQQGRYVGNVIRDRLRGAQPKPFHYRDKGNLATIGRSKAVADIKGLQLGGFVAWVIWLTVHLFYLVGFQNRLLVVMRWGFSFVTRGRGARLITNPRTAEVAQERPTTA
jgi:NADH:quinone reductase (non-electrogenic)